MADVNTNQQNDEGRMWYVVNTYSGHESKVKENLEKRVESLGLQDVVFNIVIASQTETEIVTRDGKSKRVTKEKNMFPGYVFIEMIMTDEAWYHVRNTPGVTGFIGSSGGGAKPFPVDKRQMDPILKRMGIRTAEMQINFGVGDKVKIVSGVFAGQTAKVEKIDLEREQAELSSGNLSLTIDLLKLEKVED
ncbi:MAG: transcription termination/antitermination protein NusG [Erysipelotrichaceae bacterium]|nr:transcription termination/antitermination protein NusG [Erysipelotrichaceae bacterium]